MKRSIVWALRAGLFAALLAFSSCAGGAAFMDRNAVFDDITGKEWILSEITGAENTVSIDRQKLAADNMGGYFTVSFQDGMARGVGAPNRFTGPCTPGADRALSIGRLASTMMAAFREPEGLNESGYFGYLGKVTRWNLARGKLELYSSHTNGSEAVLVFTAREE